MSIDVRKMSIDVRMMSENVHIISENIRKISDKIMSEMYVLILKCPKNVSKISIKYKKYGFIQKKSSNKKCIYLFSLLVFTFCHWPDFPALLVYFSLFLQHLHLYLLQGASMIILQGGRIDLQGRRAHASNILYQTIAKTQ